MASTRRVTVPRLMELKRGAADCHGYRYDYPSARLADEAGVDAILVGDSLAMVVLGYENTLPVTLEEMLHHVKAVARGAERALVVADMPFLSYQEAPTTRCWPVAGC